MTSTHPYTTDLCIGWTKVGECPAGRFVGVLRDLDVGEWILEGGDEAADLQSGYTLADIDTVRLLHDNDIVFAGHVRPVDTSGTGGLEIKMTDAGKRFTMAGPDAWQALTTRLAYPDPATEPPWATSHDTRSGVASTVAAAYINANLGSTALTNRRITLTVVDAGSGLSGTWTARLQRLDQLVARICREGGITCRVARNFAGALQVTLATRRDRSATLVLSDQSDLVGLLRRRIPKSRTYVIAGGQGDLTARTFRTAIDSGSGESRLEYFSDQSALGSATEVQQAADVALAAGGAAWALHAEISTAAAQQLVLGEDYDIGDTVTVEIDAVRYALPVQAVRFEITADRQQVTPVFGDAAPDLLTGLIRDVGALRSRLDNQIA